MDVILESLAHQWADAKEVERMANIRRLEIEKKMLELLPQRTEGSETVKSNHVKINVSYKLTRSIDAENLPNILGKIPAEVRLNYNPIKWKPEINLAELRKLEEQEPNWFAVLSEAITVKPSKPSVTVTMEKGKK